EPSEPSGSTPDWSLPFHLAGLDIDKFQSVASAFVPLHAYDARAAWDGADPIHPELKTHVEAAAFHGKLIYFETIYPWDQPTRQQLPPESGGQRALTVSVIAVFMIVLVGSLLVARANLRQGRGDRRGAARVAFFFFIVRMSVWLFAEHHSGLLEREFMLFFLSVARPLFEAAFLWVLLRCARAFHSATLARSNYFVEPSVGRQYS